MEHIVSPRERYKTFFNRLSDNVSSYHSLYWYTDESNKKTKKLREVWLQPSSFRADLKRDKDTSFLEVYVSTEKEISTPRRVVKDVRLNDENVFVSLDGHLCNAKEYKLIKDKHDVTDIMKDIISQQPDFKALNKKTKFDVSNKVIHFNDIPTEPIFNSVRDRGFDGRLLYLRASKYNREPLIRANPKESLLYGKFCPFVEDAYYENLSLYDDDMIWYNPSKKFVQMNHAVTKELFFDTDGYLCYNHNYGIVKKQDIDMYYKKFLFLV